MTNFSDQLFTDLMREHGPALQEAGLLTATSRRHSVRRGAWLAGGAGALAVGITTSLAAFGGTASEAYAVTPHSNGTVTVTVTDLSGVTGANATLRSLRMRVVVVPVKAGCPSIMSLPDPPVQPGRDSGPIGLKGDKRGSGSVTVEARGIPAGDLLVIAVSSTGNGTQMALRLTSPPAPACVTLPPGLPGPGGPGSGSGGTHAPAPGQKAVRTGPGGPGSGSGGVPVPGTAAG